MSITQHHPQYNTSKAALIQLTRHLAQEFKRPGVGVRVNGIAPGLFPSEMTGEEFSFHHFKSFVDELFSWE